MRWFLRPLGRSRADAGELQPAAALPLETADRPYDGDFDFRLFRLVRGGFNIEVLQFRTRSRSLLRSSIIAIVVSVADGGTF